MFATTTTVKWCRELLGQTLVVVYLHYTYITAYDIILLTYYLILISRCILYLHAYYIIINKISLSVLCCLYHQIENHLKSELIFTIFLINCNKSVCVFLSIFVHKFYEVVTLKYYYFIIISNSTINLVLWKYHCPLPFYSITIRSA